MRSDQARNLQLFSFPIAYGTRGARSSKYLLTSEKPPRFRGFARGSALYLCLIVLASPVLAQSPVLVDAGFTETVINETGQVNVTVVDGVGFEPGDHGYRVTNTFLANTEKARLVQLNGWAEYLYNNQTILGGNATGLIHHSLNVGSGIFWSATQDSPSYRDATASQWDDDGDRPYLKITIAAAGWLATQDILFIVGLENPTVISQEDPREVYCDDYPHIYTTDYWIPLCGSMVDYIAYSGVASDRTIFAGAIRHGTEAASAVRAGGVFDQHAIYVESPDGSTSHATAVLAAYATNLSAANPAWDAVRLKQELMALASDETLPHSDGETRVVKVIRPGIVPTAIEVEIPGTLSLSQNFPNPFNSSTTVTYALDRPGPVEVSVFDLTGRVVSTLVDVIQPAGHYEVRFDADRLPAGTYLYRLRTEGQTVTRTMTLVR